MSAKSLIQKIKRVFGLSGPGGAETEPAGDAQTDVTVEREPDAGAPGSSTESDLETGPDSPPTQDDDAEPAHPDAEDVSEQPTDDSQPSDDGDASSAGGESVDAIKGIGPTYSDRLSEAGIETVADLADADREAVADAAKTGETKAGSWIERARNRRS